ncbi:NAD-P-binding protein [Fomitopsis serialis]|uniref:NAD-P-binding protein n=1 Tax=Fomitopsis serialis TaxID=139415 RepID=UPI0020081C88|nr:NAD-P-binding protein [Neoantrodia serialis]KAH9922392.1 NAD-P-binding protein [Neoantrodia serialis]
MPSYAIIGGSRGIGLEFVRQLALSGENTVFVTVRNKQKSTYLLDTASKLPHKNVHILEADVVDNQAIKNAAADVAKISGGSLDVLIYNAARLEFDNILRGLLDYESEEKLDEEFIQSSKVNVLGPIHTVNAFLPLLREGTTKKIVLIGSEGGERDFVRRVHLSETAVYGITKAAENMVATKYAAELENEGFTVVAVSPGFVDVSSTYSEPAPEGNIPKFNTIAKKFYGAFPKTRPLAPQEAVERLLVYIANIGPADSGSFKPSLEFDTSTQ